MQTTTPVIVKRGFLSSLVSGVCTFLTISVICGTALGGFALHLLDKKSGDLSAISGNVLQNLPKLKESLPDALADAINDRSAVDYRSNLDVKVRLVDGRRDRQRIVVRIENNGTETISLLSLNLVMKDADAAPLGDFVAYAATPLALTHEDWRGPILPGSVREFTRTLRLEDRASEVGYEITQLRVKTPHEAKSGES